MSRLPLGKKIIYGCEARGDAASPYMTRWTIFSESWGQLCLHAFHRSDADELHDHPWPFVSLILWRGYVEVTPPACSLGIDCPYGCPRQRKRVWPGMLLFRSATHKHRVELINGERAVTLVFMGRKVRTWGFFTRQGWQRWTDYFKEWGC
jgi:hypothetical protein